MKLHTVPGHLVPDLWPAAEPLLARALKFHPFLNTDGLLVLLQDGKAALIVATEDSQVLCAAVMEVVQYPGETVGNVLALAGEQGVYRDHMCAITHYLEEWSKQHHCQKIGMVGRPGWLRFVRREGWETRSCVLASKALHNARH